MTVLSEAVDGQDWSRSSRRGRFRGADDDGAARLLRAGGADLRMTATARSTRSSSRRSGRPPSPRPARLARPRLSRLVGHELLDLPPHGTVPAVLDGVVRAPGRAWAMSAPARAAPRVAPHDLVLGGRPGQLGDVGVQLVVPLPALLARAARQVRREGWTTCAPWPSIARSRSPRGPGALDLRGVRCVGRVLSPGGAPKNAAAVAARSARASVGKPTARCEACVLGGRPSSAGQLAARDLTGRRCGKSVARAKKRRRRRRPRCAAAVGLCARPARQTVLGWALYSWALYTLLVTDAGSHDDRRPTTVNNTLS